MRPVLRLALSTANRSKRLVPSADISDGAGAQMILDAIRKRCPLIKHFFADGAYDRRKLMDRAAFLNYVVEVVHRSDDVSGFKVLPRAVGGRMDFRLADLIPAAVARL